MASGLVPIALTAKTTAELQLKIARVQALENGKVSIVAIYFDTAAKEHVCWYLPIQYGGAML